MSAEQAARKTIDELLGKAGWRVCDLKDADIHGARGIAIREFELEPPSPARAGEGRGEGGYADYLLYVDGKAAGDVEANLRRAIASPFHRRLAMRTHAPGTVRRRCACLKVRERRAARAT